jgi:transcriptional regulator with GAF, ATPase, and Fis domain
MVELDLDQRRPWTGNMEEVDAMIDRAPLEQLSQAIVNSVQVELSEEASNQLSTIKARYPDETLSEHRQPLNWMTPEDEEEYAQHVESVERMRQLQIRQGLMME